MPFYSLDLQQNLTLRKLAKPDILSLKDEKDKIARKNSQTFLK